MSSVLLKIEEDVAFITLNRPEKLNAFNRSMALELQRILDACHTHAVRCICLTGAGKGFCAGQDLAELTGPEAPSMAEILSVHYNPIIRKIRHLPIPVLAAVNGVAAGAGANLALCCDIVIAAEEAVFVQAFSKVGLIPDSGGTYFLPRLIGWQRASALMMLGEKIGAQDAVKMGMIYACFSGGEFAHAAKKMALQLAKYPTKALALTKHALNHSLNNTFEEQLELEDRFQQEAALTYDYREGISAFLEKRQPQFKGD